MAEAYLNFAKMKQYVAADGVHWTRRGDQVLEGKALARRLKKPDVQVVHHYLGRLTEVPPEAREEFWTQAEARMAASGYSDYTGTEFKNDRGEHLLVIDESC